MQLIMEEIWKTINNYEDYQVSNLGRIKSFKSNKCVILKLCDSGNGYYCVFLYKKGIGKKRNVHQIVCESFLNHIPNGMKLVVNHKNFNKLDNRVENLEIVTARENSNQKHIKSTSIYTGVFWVKNLNKWRCTIKLNGVKKHLGYFSSEIEASEYYENAIISHNKGSEIIIKIPKYTSKYTGVSWYKRLNKWRSKIQKNGKCKHLGYFNSDLDASIAYQNELSKNK